MRPRSRWWVRPLSGGRDRVRTLPVTEIGRRGAEEQWREPVELPKIQVSGDSERWPWVWRRRTGPVVASEESGWCPRPFCLCRCCRHVEGPGKEEGGER
ncbi:hypothetical protein NDU88_005286 [Pleurodeles waltl]|uniref:Uncharacterized protein n=1 Tax=Pleurodeles waltl TaxID=8319 RepID=A0AAV7RI27_PLEWA|nr:hypothetical protein NDU88_005286 [Pleurodeles waltl]